MSDKQSFDKLGSFLPMVTPPKIALIVVAIGCLMLSGQSLAYDLKHFVNLGVSFSKLDHGSFGLDYDDSTAWEQTEDTNGGHRLTIGHDLTPRLSFEFRIGNAGSYKYRKENYGVEEVNLLSSQLSVLYYLWGSRGSQGVSERRGFNVFLDGGITRLDDNLLYGSFSGLEGQYAHMGAGLEYGFDSATFIRAQISAIGSKLYTSYIGLGWRWGRD